MAIVTIQFTEPIRNSSNSYPYSLRIGLPCHLQVLNDFNEVIVDDVINFGHGSTEFLAPSGIYLARVFLPSGAIICVTFQIEYGMNSTVIELSQAVFGHKDNEQTNQPLLRQRALGFIDPSEDYAALYERLQDDIESLLEQSWTTFWILRDGKWNEAGSTLSNSVLIDDETAKEVHSTYEELPDEAANRTIAVQFGSVDTTPIIMMLPPCREFELTLYPELDFYTESFRIRPRVLSRFGWAEAIEGYCRAGNIFSAHKLGTFLLNISRELLMDRFGSDMADDQSMMVAAYFCLRNLNPRPYGAPLRIKSRHVSPLEQAIIFALQNQDNRLDHDILAIARSIQTESLVHLQAAMLELLPMERSYRMPCHAQGMRKLLEWKQLFPLDRQMQLNDYHRAMDWSQCYTTFEAESPQNPGVTSDDVRQFPARPAGAKKVQRRKIMPAP